METCDLSVSAVSISGGTLTCGSTTYDGRSAVTLNGSSSTNTIEISNSSFTVTFNGIHLSSPAPFQVSRSDVTLIIDGSNEVHATGTDFAAIGCSDDSRMTFVSTVGGRLTVTSSGGGAAIGTNVNGVCSVLRFLNGTYDVNVTGLGSGIGAGRALFGSSSIGEIAIDSGNFTIDSNLGAGIGAGAGSEGGLSTVSLIAIAGGNFTMRPGWGSGIGSGCSDSGNSSVSVVLITGGTFSGTAGGGAVIGCGSAAGGLSLVSTLQIEGGIFRLYLTWGAGVGGGRSDIGGTSMVSQLVITGGEFAIAMSARYAAAIGTGCAYGGLSKVSTITISGGTFVLEARYGAAVGTGCSYSGTAHVDNIVIVGGDLRSLKSRNGAVIGGGQARPNVDVGPGPAVTSVGWISIENCGSGSLIHEHGAGIGAGTAGSEIAMTDNTSGSAFARVDGITISGGAIQITTNGTASFGAGIGSGQVDSFGDPTTSTVGNVTIVNASIRVRMGAGSAAIGSSWTETHGSTNASLARAQVDFVGIYGGEFVLWAMDGPMIGTGAGLCGMSIVKEVVIDGARIRPPDDVQAGRGIGTYDWVEAGGKVGIDVVRFKAGHLKTPPGLPVGAIGEFVVTNGTIDMNGSMLRTQVEAMDMIGEIRFEQGEDDVLTFFCPFANRPCWVSQVIGGKRIKVVARQGTPQLFSTGLEGTTSLDLYIQYLNTSEREPINNFPLLRLVQPPFGQHSKVRVGRIADDWTRTVEYDGPNGFLMALPEVGSYEVSFRTPGAVTDDVLCHEDGSVLQVGLGDSLFENMSICIPSPTQTSTPTLSQSLSFSPSPVLRTSASFAASRTFTSHATTPLPTTSATLPMTTPASTVTLPTATPMLAMTTVWASSGEVVQDKRSGTPNTLLIGVLAGVGVVVVGGLIGCCMYYRRRRRRWQSDTGNPISRSSSTGSITRHEHEFESVAIGEENDPYGFNDPDGPWDPVANAPLYTSLATPFFPV